MHSYKSTPKRFHLSNSEKRSWRAKERRATMISNAEPTESELANAARMADLPKPETGDARRAREKAWFAEQDKQRRIEAEALLAEHKMTAQQEAAERNLNALRDAGR